MLWSAIVIVYLFIFTSQTIIRHWHSGHWWIFTSVIRCSRSITKIAICFDSFIVCLISDTIFWIPNFVRLISKMISWFPNFFSVWFLNGLLISRICSFDFSNGFLISKIYLFVLSNEFVISKMFPFDFWTGFGNTATWPIVSAVCGWKFSSQKPQSWKRYIVFRTVFRSVSLPFRHRQGYSPLVISR